MVFIGANFGETFKIGQGEASYNVHLSDVYHIYTYYVCFFNYLLSTTFVNIFVNI